jgi:hypothetical protein
MANDNICLEQFLGFEYIDARSVVIGSRMVAVNNITSISMEAKNIPQDVAEIAFKDVELHDDQPDKSTLEGTASTSWAADPSYEWCNLSVSYTKSEAR